MVQKRSSSASANAQTTDRHVALMDPLAGETSSESARRVEYELLKSMFTEGEELTPSKSYTRPAGSFQLPSASAAERHLSFTLKLVRTATQRCLTTALARGWWRSAGVGCHTAGGVPGECAAHGVRPLRSAARARLQQHPTRLDRRPSGAAGDAGGGQLGGRRSAGASADGWCA